MQRNAPDYIDQILNRLVVLSLLLGCLGSFYANESQAQGTAQVILTGLPPVLNSPYISDLEQHYQQGLFATQFIFVSPSRQPRAFRFRLSLEVNGELVIDMTSEANEYTPGIHLYRTFDDEPRISFPLSYAEWVSRIGARTNDTGLLPEGDYVLTVEPLLDEEETLIPTLPGIAYFTVRYADPPLLLSPLDASSLTTQLPVFSWTPVTGVPPGSMMEYELIIAEVLPGQAPHQALESNRELVRDVLIGQTSFVYTFEQLPLEKGKTYVWQVRARDVAERVPLLDRGETELYTFTVGAEGLGSMITSWSFPISTPFLIYPFDEDADLEPTDTEIYIDGLQPVKLNGFDSQAQFDQLLIDAETQAIIEGSLYLPDALAIEVAINPLSDLFSGYTIVPSGAGLTLQDGLLLEIGSNVQINNRGMHPRGTHRATISYSGMPTQEWTATYSEDLDLSLSPFNVTQGRIDFASEGVARAYADPAGFHFINQNDPVLAQAPDRILLPDADLAYIPLKRAGMLLVNIEETSDGLLLLSGRPGAELELVLPGLQDPLKGEAPRYTAQFDEVTIDAATGRLVEGSIDAAVPETGNYTLDPIGIPLAPTAFSATGASGNIQMEMAGILTIFGKPLQQSETVRFTIGADHVVSGSINLEDSLSTVFLDDLGKTRLNIVSATGDIRVPLNQQPQAAIDLELSGSFGIYADDSLAASANLAFRYQGEGRVPFTHFASDWKAKPSAEISFDNSALAIHAIDALGMNYSVSAGLQYVASLQSEVVLQTGEERFSLPLNQAELRENGFIIPRQELHADIPAFEPVYVSGRQADLELLAMQMPATRVPWFQEGNKAALNPLLDFEVHFKAIEHLAPSLNTVPLTLQNAVIEEGYLAGLIVPYRFLSAQPPWQLDAGTLFIESIKGAFYPSSSGQQFTLEAAGHFELQAPVADGLTACEIPAFNLQFISTGSITGTSGPFAPCHAFNVGPIAAQFRNDATLNIVTNQDSSRSVLAGSIAAIRSRSATTVPQGEGTLAVNVVSGELLDADLAIQQLVWIFPSEAPRYRLEIDEAQLTSEGFTFSGDSTVTAILLEDDTAYRFASRNTFILGIDPARKNTGRAELTPVSSAARNGDIFTEDGFQGAATLPSSVERISLPGGHGAYLQLTGGLDNALNLERDKDTKSLVATTKVEAKLILPLIGSTRDKPEIPVSFKLTLNEAFAYVNGSFEADLSDKPVDLTSMGYPMRITSVSYDGTRSLAERLRIEAEVMLPEQLANVANSGTLPIEFTVGAGGLEALATQDLAFELYQDALTLGLDRITIDRGQANRQPLTLAGDVQGAIFGRDTTQAANSLRYQATYNHLANRWEFNLSPQMNQRVSLGKGILNLDPNKPPTLETDTGLTLLLAGKLAFPSSISDAFALDIALEIGPGGIYASHTGALTEKQQLFNGFLDVYLDAVDLTYHTERKALVATLDGAFAPHLNTAPALAGAQTGPTDLLPFTGLSFGSDGIATSLSFSGTESDALALDLLGTLPSLPVIDQLFSIDGIKLHASPGGLLLHLDGLIRLPERSNSGTSYASRIPVSLVIDSAGRLLDENMEPMRTVFATTTTLSQTQPIRFQYDGVHLDFDPAYPEATRLFAAGHMSLLTDVLPVGMDSSVVDTVQLQPSHMIAFGDRWHTRYQPGVILAQHRPNYYLLTDTPGKSKPLFTLAAPLANINITSITLPDPARLVMEMAGRAKLNAEGMNGYFPIKGIAIDAQRVRSLGEAEGPAVVSFRNSAAFELGCFDYSHQNISAPAPSSAPSASVVSRLVFGANCEATPKLTVTDQWFAGTFNNLSVFDDGFTSFNARVDGTDIRIDNLATLQGNFTYEKGDSGPSLRFQGNTQFEDINLPTAGVINLNEGAPHLSLLFSPADRPLSILPGAATGNIAGGGLFLRPTPADFDLVNLVINERSNNQFTSNHPNPQTNRLANQLSLLLPIEFSLHSNDTSADITGTGLLTATQKYTYLDIDGSFNNQTDELATNFFLVRHKPGNAPPTLEGIANISLNYSGVLGGVVKTNFSASRSSENSYGWSAYGLSRMLVTDTIELPGRLLLTTQGLLTDLHDNRDLTAGPLDVANDLNIAIWQNRASGKMGGYTAFDANLNLIPGFTMATLKLYGGLLEDREEYLLYAANNIFADIPFVYTGAIDPWFSLQDGLTYGGDARNNTFLRMIVDAREHSRTVPTLAQQATEALEHALTVQEMVANDVLTTGNISFFARPDSLLETEANRLLAQETSAIQDKKLPEIFQNIVDQLYRDEAHPDYGRFPEAAPQSLDAMAAWQEMRAGLISAQQSAETDLFTFESLAPRPLIWTNNPKELTAEIRTSPLRSVSWPMQASDAFPAFEIDSNAFQLQSNSLLAFKQGNEAQDVQFLRSISGLELNLVNLKISRSPEQGVDFSRASSHIARFKARQLADDWALLSWSTSKQAWLEDQENAITRGIRDNLKAYTSRDDADAAMRTITQERFALLSEMAGLTDWKRDDLPEDTSFGQYIAGLEGKALEDEFQTTARDLWYDVPLTALTALQDTLTVLTEQRAEKFSTSLDTLNAAYGTFTRSLDPLYDTQTKFTTTLYGMAEEYSTWRASIRRLDPEAVNYAFQFDPYRGNYRILAEDLAPAEIEAIKVTPSGDAYFNETRITWTASHPVNISDASLAISQDTSTVSHFASVASGEDILFYTTKPDAQTTDRSVQVILRVRGAGGIPAVKKGHFTVPVDPRSSVELLAEETPLIPTDDTPPQTPTIANLRYSSYFSDTPNTLQFQIDTLRDDESGIAQIEYRIVNEKDPEDVLQDWTQLQKSTDYFSGRLIETSLPVQEEDITIRVTVRATNETGLQSESHQSMALDLDDTPPLVSLETVTYFNAFDIEHPQSLLLTLNNIQDQESGVDHVEYAFLRTAQANLADANWRGIPLENDRTTETGPQSIYLNLQDEQLSEGRNTLALFLRVTNGAGLQTVINRAIELPGVDQTPPTEPVVAIAHSGFYTSAAPNQLSIILSGSQDFESGISRVEYRVIDGQSGTAISDWDDFALLDPNVPTYILPASKKTLSLPAFDSSRPVIVEARATNLAGLTSNKAVRFLQLELDDTPPSQPGLGVTYFAATDPNQPNTLQLEIGESQDAESQFAEIAYRIIDPGSQQIVTDWQTLATPLSRSAVFPGLLVNQPAPALPADVTPEVQVRLTNKQGLSTIVGRRIAITRDVTPPSKPSLSLAFADAPEGGMSPRVMINLGASTDPQSRIAKARYRIRDLQQPAFSLYGWEVLPLGNQSGQFESRQLTKELPELENTANLMVEAEITNGAGLTTTVSGIVDTQPASESGGELLVTPALASYYFGPNSIIRPGELELTIMPAAKNDAVIDSVQYRLTLLDAAGASIEAAGTSRWRLLSSRSSYLDQPQTVYIDVPTRSEAVSAKLDLRVKDDKNRTVEADVSFNLDGQVDLTPPDLPIFETVYYGYYHPNKTNEIELLVDRIADPESRMAAVAYRIINDADTNNVFVDWTALPGISDNGFFESSYAAVKLPDLTRNTVLRVEVAATNGAGLKSVAYDAVSLIVDTTPPELEKPVVTLSDLYSGSPTAFIDAGTITDLESNITLVEYRVSLKQDSTALVDWTPIAHPTAHTVRAPILTTRLGKYSRDRTLVVELRGRNEAGLESQSTNSVEIDIDNTPPQLPRIELSYKDSPLGIGYVLIAPGAFRDAESHVASIAYRVVAAGEPDTILIDWVDVPIVSELRTSIAPIALPRSNIPFDGALDISIEMRATNRAGLFDVRSATIAIPGDTSPPEKPMFIVAHNNAYDPLNPNSIELQIGSSIDDQSAIASARYRIIEPSTGRAFAEWTELSISTEGFFPGTVHVVELPFLQNSTTLRADLEIKNTAGLTTALSESVRVDVENDVTPPEASIALHYFSDGMALVMERLADNESKIQQVEYRFLDNVDQTELMAWTDLFEITIPQSSYPKQSFNVPRPAVRTGRTLKVEIRVTNGAGLQTTVSKTVLFRQDGIGH